MVTAKLVMDHAQLSGYQINDTKIGTLVWDFQVMQRSEVHQAFDTERVFDVKLEEQAISRDVSFTLEYGQEMFRASWAVPPALPP